jgi:hypothetical protein
LKIQYFPSQVSVRKNIENFNISENNLFSVEAAKLVGYTQVMKVKKCKHSIYIFGYLLEPNIEILHFLLTSKK